MIFREHDQVEVQLESQAVDPTSYAPGLTVVVLTYNSRATIGPCLASLVGQEFKDFEVLVVDDDSEDDTLEIVSAFSPRLRTRITRNGSHSIPRGRNIGLAQARTAIVAFLDSDDSALPDWTRVIVQAFQADASIACISGDLHLAYRTATGHAIALNDDAVRRCFGGHALISGGNSAINRTVDADTRFDEDFRFAEDLDLITRFAGVNRWRHVPEMKINHFSRDTLGQYSVQMYRYGFMKQLFAFRSRSYRWLDFVPLILILCGVATSLAIWTWWPLTLVIVLSLLEAAFVIVYQRCPLRVAALTFPAWVVKNVTWTCGTCVGLVTLGLRADVRRSLRSKRIAGLPLTRDWAKS